MPLDKLQDVVSSRTLPTGTFTNFRTRSSTNSIEASDTTEYTSQRNTGTGTSTDSTTITDYYSTSDKTTRNEENTGTSSTSGPYDDGTKITNNIVTEIRCNGRAICKDLLRG